MMALVEPYLYKTSIPHHNINNVTMKDKIKRNRIYYYENTFTRKLEEEKHKSEF
jgi:hypothetical protein